MATLPERYDPDWFAPEVFDEREAFSIAYAELRSIARYLVRGEAYSPTLQATEALSEWDRIDAAIEGSGSRDRGPKTSGQGLIPNGSGA